MAQWSKKVFADNLRRYMDRSGKSQKELAEIAGVSTATFSEWVNAKKYPRIDRIEMLANYFGILKSDLIEEKPTTREDDELSKAKQALIAKIMSFPDDKVNVLLSVAESIEQLYSEGTPPTAQE